MKYCKESRKVTSSGMHEIHLRCEPSRDGVVVKLAGMHCLRHRRLCLSDMHEICVRRLSDRCQTMKNLKYKQCRPCKGELTIALETGAVRKVANQS